MSDDTATLLALQVAPVGGMRLESAPVHRAWISHTPHGFARRCLPLLVANQQGWCVISSFTTTATWDGSTDPEGVTISSDGAGQCGVAMSHFGSGLLTWTLPWLFRTPPGVDLLLRGPANDPKDGASPLEGVIETDWSPATATMNWKLTRPHFPVTFEAGEPLAMITPQARGYVEQFRPRLTPLRDYPEIEAEYCAWRRSRTDFLRELAPRERRRDEWQGDYFSGRIGPAQPQEVSHMTRLRLRDFETDHEGVSGDAGLRRRLPPT